MADLVTLTIDDKQVSVPPGTLVINAAKTVGIEIPAFCYYEGLELQAACRMCLVEVEKMPKLMASCTLPVRDGMVVRTDSPKVVSSRKAMLEFLLTNHPLDCPVCDKGGECELQDLVFRYGAGEGRFTHIKHHVEEKQFSPVVYFDAPRCILCYRCVRICDEGMGVKALGVVNRGTVTEIGPSNGDHLECDECGMCIDICPVGALTSGIYRYQTRPWEMKHVGTICTHCSNGCKTTLGVRNNEIIRGNNRDRTGINGEFLCIKGRYAFDFTGHEERLTTPLVKRAAGFEAVSWVEAIKLVAERFRDVAGRDGRFGVAGSTRSTNEENYYLQKFARQALRTNNIDHERSGDIRTLLSVLNGRSNALARTADLYESKAALVLASDLAQQHPLLAYQLRANWRHHRSHTYVVTRGPVREDLYATKSLRAASGEELDAVESLVAELRNEPELVVLFGDAIQGDGLRRLVAFCESLPVPVKYVCLMDYSNSRGATDMGLMPDLGPGYRAVESRGLSLPEMMAADDLDVMWVLGANPLRERALASRQAFVVAHSMFLTETAQNADVVLPAASAYEKKGTVTNVCGEVQRLTRAIDVMGPKTDLEIVGMLTQAMGIDIGLWDPKTVWEEIRTTVPGYGVDDSILATGGSVQTVPEAAAELPSSDAPVSSAGDTLFTSGTLGRYSKILHQVTESPGALYQFRRAGE